MEFLWRNKNLFRKTMESLYMITMPRIADKRDKHLRLELDTEDLYNAFQLIKKRKGIRNNTDVLRYLILEEANRLIREKQGKEKD